MNKVHPPQVFTALTSHSVYMASISKSVHTNCHSISNHFFIYLKLFICYLLALTIVKRRALNSDPSCVSFCLFLNLPTPPCSVAVPSILYVVFPNGHSVYSYTSPQRHEHIVIVPSWTFFIPQTTSRIMGRTSLGG